VEFQLSEEYRMIQGMVREFASREILPRAALLDRTGEYPADIIHAASALGLMGMMVPEEYGGAGQDSVSYVIAQEELARASAAVQTIITVNNSLACDPILRWGSDDLKRRYLPELASGRALGCYCLTEPSAGSDAMALAATARLDGDGWVLNGTKTFVTNGVEADICIVYARTGPEPGARGISAFVVEKAFPGIRVGKVEHKLGILGSSTAEIVLDGCRVPSGHILGEPGHGGRIALATLDGGRLGIAAQAAGIARAALEDATRYAKERRQFGHMIGEFEAVQWFLADMAVRLDAARLLIYRAAYLRDQGRPYTKEVAMAKLFASETAMWAAHKAVQIHGGYGYVKEYNVERYFRDAKITEIYEGTSEIQRLVIARNVLKH